MTLTEVMAELASLEDPKIRAVNERYGDDHGVNLTKLRALAKRIKTRHEFAGQLWATGDSAARLLALLICRPRSFSQDELDAMLRDARVPKVQDWLVNYVVKKSPHVEALRVSWFDEAQMADAPERLQWAMNACLAQIGIEHPEYRARALEIGERLEVLKDYPTSPGCTSPFAPIWITEMVRRQAEQA